MKSIVTFDCREQLVRRRCHSRVTTLCRHRPRPCYQDARGRDSPLLRKQKGFQDEITLLAAGGREAVGISLWDQKESAETYERGAYAEVLKTMGKLIEGTPQVKTYEVSTSTIQK